MAPRVGLRDGTAVPSIKNYMCVYGMYSTTETAKKMSAILAPKCAGVTQGLRQGSVQSGAVLFGAVMELWGGDVCVLCVFVVCVKNNLDKQ